MSPKALAAADFAPEAGLLGPLQVRRARPERPHRAGEVRRPLGREELHLRAHRVPAHSGHDRAPRQPALRQSRSSSSGWRRATFAAVKGDSNLVFAPVTGIGYQGLTINTNNGERAKSPARPGQARAPGASSSSIDRNVINEVVGAGIYPAGGPALPGSEPLQQSEIRGRQARRREGEAAAEGSGRRAGEVRADLRQQARRLSRSPRSSRRWPPRRASTSRCGRPSSPPCRRRPRPATSTSNVIGWSGRVDPDGNIHHLRHLQGRP